MKGIIYKYTNKINGKIYIGQTIDEERRKLEHFKAKDDFYFHRALRKYGMDNFQYDVLYSSTEINNKNEIIDVLNKLETEYILKYNSYKSEFGYNQTKGGNSTYPIDKFKPIQQLDLCGNVLNEFESIQEAFRHLKHRPSGKITLCCQGKRGSFLGFKWRYFDVTERSKYPEFKPINNKTAINKIDPITGDILNTYESIAEACRDNNIVTNRGSNSSIIACCRGKYKTVYGYRWEFVDKTKLSIVNNSVSNSNCPKAVQKLNEKGEVIEEFLSISDASENTGISRVNIKSCCSGKSITAGGFYWRFKDEKIRQPQKKNSKREGISVVQIDPNSGKELGEFSSMMAAARSMGLDSSSSIKSCCNGTSSINLAGGYNWKYKNKIK